MSDALSAPEAGLSLEAAADRYAEARRQADDRARDERGRFAAGEEPERDETLTAGDGVEEYDDGQEERDDEAPPENDEGDAEEVEEPTEQRVLVKIGGEERELPLSEVVAGYQKGEDYTRKTAELAEQRRTFEATVQRVAAERHAYTALLKQVADRYAAEAPSLEAIDQLMQTDPVEGWRADQLRKQILAQADEYAQGYHQMVQAVLAEAQEDQRRSMVEAMRALPQLIPEWRDPARYQAEAPQIAQTMLAAGFKTDELNAIDDPRAMVVARKAWLWDQLQAAKGQKLQPARPTTKPSPTLRPGAGNDRPRRGAERADALIERAASSGSLDDVAAAFRATRRT